MANYLVTDTQLTSVADAIRAKTGSNAGMSFPDGMVNAVGSISAGSAATDGDVIFIDYDGTVVAAKTKAQINAMSSDSDLPANPTHTGLVAQGWNWTVAQLKAQLTAMPDQKVYVGQMYVTESGATEIDVLMQGERLSPILTICVNGTATVDWGDGTTPDTIIGTSGTTSLDVGPHNYASAGNYTIKISATSGTYSFYESATQTLLRKNLTQSENRVYTSCIKAVRIGNGITSIKDYIFYGCYTLTNITIPSSITSIGNSVFQNCYTLTNITIPNNVTNIRSSTFYGCCSLTSLAIPSSVTNIGNSVFYNCYSLTSLTIPSGVTSIGSNAFYGCYTLTNITIPSNVTSIKGQAFQNCYSLLNPAIPSGVTSIGDSAFQNCQTLTSITIPSTVTSIGNNTFNGCYGVAKYHILPTTVPTAGTTIFQNIVSDCIIYVPYSEDHSILESYKTASNWSGYASYMQEEPST